MARKSVTKVGGGIVRINDTRANHTKIVKTDTAKEAVLHCYVCGVEVDEDDIIEGPEIPLCPDCYTKWQDRCYEQLEEMKKEVKK